MGGAEHPGILYFYSESIGFAANGTCAFIAALSNLGVVEERNVSTAILFLVVGGIIQLLPFSSGTSGGGKYRPVQRGA